MPIVVQYGPVASALQAASIAGKGQGFNIQAGRDLAALQIQNQMQSEIDRNNAMEMQNAMAYQQQASQRQLQQQSLAQQAAQQNAYMQLQQTGQQFNQQRATAEQQAQQDQMNERAREFDALQGTRQQQADAMSQLRQAQTDKLNSPTPSPSAAIQANSLALRMDQQAGQFGRQLEKLQGALAKASDPYTGDKQKAAAIQDQINGIKFSLDGIDPATGKKSGRGLNDQRQALRDILQKVGTNLRPDATLSPSEQGGYDLNNQDPNSAGLDNPDDPLYQTNNPPPPPGMSYGTMPSQGQAGAMPAQPAMPAYAAQPASGVGERGPATPGLTYQIGQAVAQKLGLSPSDPRVTQATIQYLQSQGYTPPLIH